MKGPTPKPAALRARRNRTTTAASLPSVAESATRAVPPLPPREKLAEVWHPRVLEWWDSVWTSPMAAEYLDADMRGGMFLLAELYQRRWTEADTKTLVGLASEIRHQEVRFGVSPIDRRRLQWEVEKAETAAEKTEKRHHSKRLAETSKKDPRDVLRIAK
jgi:hypothetical protein